MDPIEQLVEISRRYGADKRYVIAGGGNTSYKDKDRLWVKASGRSLATITVEGFAVMDRHRLNIISERQYSDDIAQREQEVKNDLAAATLTPGLRPSVETSLHNAMSAPYVVHLHPAVVNALMCSRQAAEKTAELFAGEALYVPYTDPGYVLFKKVEEGIAKFSAKNGRQPDIIFLQNHGIFVGGRTPGEITATYDRILDTIEKHISATLPDGELPVGGQIATLIPAVRTMLSNGERPRTLKVTNSPLIECFSASGRAFSKVARPFTPDHIVYCKSGYLYLETTDLTEIEKDIKDFITLHGYTPKVIMIKDIGLVCAGDNAAQSDTVTEVFTDMLHIAWLAGAFGGESPMTDAQIDFIDNWEVENYRRNVGSMAASRRVENKSIIVTGAAQGFGEGIAGILIREGANVVVADLNEEAGVATVDRLNVQAERNRAIFVRTDVSDTESLTGMVHVAVKEFGGIDAFVSNAGVLRAGGIDDMTPEAFDFVTRINYSAYFYGVRAVSPVMKLQNTYAPDAYCDIIQVNSKSGLRGSKANFAYAGGKFGGIGLTQSFALELAPYRIKVNSICPGNFYEGPLWSDPDDGLFVQYLKAGKVPGAKTIDDVREFYMAQVPMRKGTNPEDVAKAIFYAIEQTCETGQAIPVTGGQVMLG